MAIGLALGAVGLIGGLAQQFVGGASPSKVGTEQLFEQQTIFGEQQGFEKQLANLWANPSSVTQTPGYQFQLQQGLQGVARQYGAQGLGGGGAATDALMRYGQGFAANSWQQQLQMLAGLSGITSASSPAQLGSVAANQAQANTQNVMGSGGGGIMGALGGMIGSFL